MFESAASISLQAVRMEEDEDLATYLKNLRQELIDAYVSITHGVSQDQF